MSSEPIRETSGPDAMDQSDGLTDEQRVFAGVVGRALAEAWHRKVAGKPSVPSQQHARPSPQTH